MTRRGFTAFVEALVQNRRPRRFRASPEDARAMRVAIELQSGRAEDAVPDAQFVSDLREQLSQELDEQRVAVRAANVNRRLLLQGAGVAACAAGVAVAVDRTVFAASAPAVRPSALQELTPEDGTWHTVATLASLTEGVPARFETRAAVGFVTNDAGSLQAVSGVCTHQGCLLQSNQAARRLDCPCHHTAFSASGQVLFSKLETPPAPLPRVQVRQENGQVQVLLPPPI